MRIAVFEDDDTKWGVIKAELLCLGADESNVIRYSSVTEFASIGQKPTDLFVLDIRMPGVPGGTERSSGTELLQMIEMSGNRRVPTLAITAYEDEISSLREEFASRGCIIFDFYKKQNWSQALSIFFSQAKERGRYEFIIFCALQKERNAFIQAGLSVRSNSRNGLDVLEVHIADRLGGIVLLPRMGLVNCTAVVARALEVYSPSIIAMSGICAGLSKDGRVGELLVADIMWEYQSGKWLEDAFEAEPYQTNIGADIRLFISDIMNEDGLISELESGYTGSVRPTHRSKPEFAAFATGSAVIASQKRLESVKNQHRKVAGLDMEIFGFHRAAELAAMENKAFSAKVVVDRADDKKGDELHEYGCFVSAAFVIKVITAFILENTSRTVIR